MPQTQPDTLPEDEPEPEVYELRAVDCTSQIVAGWVRDHHLMLAAYAGGLVSDNWPIEAVINGDTWWFTSTAINGWYLLELRQDGQDVSPAYLLLSDSKALKGVPYVRYADDALGDDNSTSAERAKEAYMAALLERLIPDGSTADEGKTSD
jgi:hypothetical protein